MVRGSRREFLCGTGAVGAATFAGCTDLLGSGSAPEERRDGGTVRSIERSTTIDDPGAYELGADLSSEGTGIEIHADDVVIDGRGHVVVGDSPGPEQHGIHVTGDDVTVTDVEVRGWDDRGAGILFESVTGGEISGVTAIENQHGVRLLGSATTAVSGNTVTDNGEFGIALEGAMDNTVRANTVARNVESGVLLWESANNAVAGNTLTDNELVNNLGAIHLDGDRTGSDGNELRGNELTDNGDTAMVLIGSDGNDARNNAMANNGRHGVFLEGSSGNTLTKNTATGNDISGIDLAWESDDNRITANTLNDNRGHGIWLIDSHENEVGNNSTVGNDQMGIILADASDNVLTENEVADNTLGGIDLIGEDQYTPLVGSHGNEVSDNEITDNEARDGSGIRLLHSDDNTLAGNAVTGTGDHGITLFESVGNRIAGNVVSGNDRDGVRLEVDVEGSVLTSNLLSNNANGVGVGIETTGSVVIDANDIEDNGEYGVVVRDMHAGGIPDEADEIANVDATNNWWGARTGPSHATKNPEGTGDGASDNVDFEPWAETRFG